MVGIIDVGGGLRGIYGAGVFDRCIDDNVSFDCCIGVSAGSANIASFLGNQRGRNYLFYHEYAFRKEYMSLSNFIKTGSYIGLDYVYSTLTNSDGENPINHSKMAAYNGIFNIVATNAETAEPKYFSFDDISFDNYRVFSASCCIPVVCRPVDIDGNLYYDGGVSDPVPVDRALNLGCDKIVLLLTKPANEKNKTSTDSKAAAIMKRKNPKIADALINRAEMYNASVAKAKELERDGKCLIVAPDDCCGTTTLSRNAKNLDRLYNKGYNDGKSIKEFLKSR